MMKMPKLVQAIIGIGAGVMLVIVVHAADMTPYAYVELTKQSMAQKVQDLNQSIGAISGFSAGPEAWATEEAQLNTQFDTRFETLYDSFGVSGDQFILYYSENRNDVESYLEVHPEDNARIEELGTQIATLLDQYEQRKIDMLQIVAGAGDMPLPRPPTP